MSIKIFQISYYTLARAILLANLAQIRPIPRLRPNVGLTRTVATSQPPTSLSQPKRAENDRGPNWLL